MILTSKCGEHPNQGTRRDPFELLALFTRGAAKAHRERADRAGEADQQECPAEAAQLREQGFRPSDRKWIRPPICE